MNLSIAVTFFSDYDNIKHFISTCRQEYHLNTERSLLKFGN